MGRYRFYLSERPALRPIERRYAWMLTIIGVLVALFAQLTRPASDDVEGLLGVLGLVFSLGFIGLVGTSALAAGYLMSSSGLRVLTILAGPVLGLFALDVVIRQLNRSADAGHQCVEQRLLGLVVVG